MIAPEHILRQHRDEILRIAAKHGARNVRLFGSAAAGRMSPASDIDLLIDVGPTTSPWFPSGLVLELEALLHRPIDIVTPAGLHPLIRDQVLREARAL